MKKFIRPIKVANIIEEGRVGGPQKRILMVASKISSKIDTTVIMPKKNSHDFRILCKKFKIKYITSSFRIIQRDIFSIVSYFFLFPYEVILLAKLLKKNKFDIVHISGGSWQYKGIIAAKIANIRAVWHLNDSYIPLVFKFIFKLLSPLATAYIFSAYSAKKYYFKYVNINKPNFIIPPPVDTAFFNPSQNYFKNKVLNNNWKNLVLIGTVANINKTKGLETFIKAGSVLNKNFKNLHFLVIGKVFQNQKNYFNKLRKLCEKVNFSNIDFIKNCSDVRPLLQRLDIFAVTSLSETGPMTLWEAMSMEKPIVATNVGDVKNYINNHLNGYIIDVKDHEALANRIANFIKTPKIRKNFGKNARQVVKNKLDLSLCANLHLQAYHSIININ